MNEQQQAQLKQFQEQRNGIHQRAGETQSKAVRQAKEECGENYASLYANANAKMAEGYSSLLREAVWLCDELLALCKNDNIKVTKKGNIKITNNGYFYIIIFNFHGSAELDHRGAHCTNPNSLYKKLDICWNYKTRTTM